jgi:serine/threonine-protein kinase RsbW
VVELTIVNRGSEIARVAGEVDRLGIEYRIAEDALADIQVALDEVLTNVIDYGYADGAEHLISVRLQVVDGVFEATIEDDGRPFDPLASAPPDLNAALRERTVGGLGVHFVKNLMTDVVYERIGGHNRLVLRKRIEG